MGPAMDLVRLNPLVKKAITLVTGVLISLTETEIQLAVTCKVPWFKVSLELVNASLISAPPASCARLTWTLATTAWAFRCLCNLRCDARPSLGWLLGRQCAPHCLHALLHGLLEPTMGCGRTFT